MGAKPPRNPKLTVARDAAGPQGLNCLGGRAPDEALRKRWESFLALPPAARERIWDVLLPIVRRSPDPEIRDRAMQLASAHDVLPDSLMLALQACQHLVTKAGEMNLEPEPFGQDLAVLSGDHEQAQHARDVILGGYDGAKTELQRRTGHDSILAHGKLATRAEWRLDRILSSNHGFHPDLAIPFLTLSYREGSREERVTLQLSNDVVRQLKEFCDAFPGGN